MFLDELYDVIKDQNGEIQGVSFNSYLVNKMQNMLVNNINLSLRAIEEGKIELLELPNTISIIYDENKLKKGIIYRNTTWCCNKKFISCKSWS